MTTVAEPQRGPRRASAPVDPLLAATVAGWKRAGRAKREVLAAVEEAYKVSPLSPEVAREQRQQLADLIDQLGGRAACDRWLWQLITKQKKGELPFAILLEVVRRIAEYRPANVWAYIESVMARDYPAYAWRR